MVKGKFITFEGPEGAGKTTIQNLLKEKLEQDGYPCIQTREPGGIEIAEQIRNVILDKRNTKMDGKTEALLYAAARRQHLVERIIPALNEGKIVLCDRFIDSSLSYQGFARSLGIEEVYQINQFAIDGVLPDITLLFDIDPEMGLRRIKKNEDREVNRLDLETLHFHKKVREGYLLLHERFPKRIVKIDANQPVEKVLNDAYNVVMNILS